MVLLKRALTPVAVLLLAGGVAHEGTITNGRVEVAVCIIQQCKRSTGRVLGTVCVKCKRASSNSGVLCAAGVKQKRCGPHCGIGIRVVENQRSTPTPVLSLPLLSEKSARNQARYFLRQC